MTDSLRLIETIHRVTQCADAAWFDAARALGCSDLTPRQASILEAIAQSEHPSQTVLVDLTFIDRSTLSEICRRLVERRLVTRRRRKDDNRAYEMQLTAAGQTALEAARKVAAAAARQIRKDVAGLDGLAVAAAHQDAA